MEVDKIDLDRWVKVAFLRSEILKLRNKLIDCPDYGGSKEAIQMEWNLVEYAMNELSFDYEKDDELMAYCIKATDVECWDYWLVKVLPMLDYGHTNM